MNPVMVLDSSVPLAVCFNENDRAEAISILNLCRSKRVIVAAIFPIELANVITNGVRRQRLTLLQAHTFIEQTNRLPVVMDDPIKMNEIGLIRELAERHQLTCYDASYLSIAIKYQIPLATYDNALLRASKCEALPAFSVGDMQSMGPVL